MLLSGTFKPYDEMFDHLFKVVSSPRFLHKQGLGKEVPFFIQCFDPANAFRLESDVTGVSGKLKTEHGIKVQHLNLYRISLQMLREAEVLDTILEEESTYDKSDLLDTLRSLLDPETNLIPAIRAIIAEQSFDLVFITGVGEVYPYIRAHTVLNNLQSTLEEQPTVMFFPGNYSYNEVRGASLDLFTLMPGDRYYRAFNLDDYQVS